MPDLETRPGKITIPGKPESIDLSRIGGNIGTIRHEITNSKMYIESLPGNEDIKAAVLRGERVFLTGSDGIMFVKPISEGPTVGETILIPGRPVEVDLNQASGDIRSGIRFEIGLETRWITELEKGLEVQNTLQNGGRVFITEDDDLLFVNPPFTSD